MRQQRQYTVDVFKWGELIHSCTKTIDRDRLLMLMQRPDSDMEFDAVLAKWTSQPESERTGLSYVYTRAD